MKRTVDKYKEDIEDLKSFCDDIGKFVSNIKAGCAGSNMNFLEKKGVDALCSDVYELLQKIEDHVDDIVATDIEFPVAQEIE